MCGIVRIAEGVLLLPLAQTEDIVSSLKGGAQRVEFLVDDYFTKGNHDPVRFSVSVADFDAAFEPVDALC